VYFPLTLSPQDAKSGVDTMLTDTEMTEPVPISGPIPANDGNLLSMKGQFSSTGMPPGGGLEGGGDGKVGIKFI
jgi:hypothetical protein